MSSFVGLWCNFYSGFFMYSKIIFFFHAGPDWQLCQYGKEPAEHCPCSVSDLRLNVFITCVHEHTNLKCITRETVLVGILVYIICCMNMDHWFFFPCSLSYRL